MNWEVFSIKEKDKWNKAIDEFPLRLKDIYFMPEYYEVHQKYGDGEAFCFYYKNEDHIAFYPFLKNTVNRDLLNSKREYFDIQGVYGYNGVLSSSYKPDFIDAFYKEFNSYCQNENIIAEFSRFHPLINNYKFSKEHLKVIKDRRTVWLDLKKAIEEIWKEEFSSKNRNMIRKAEKSGMQFRLGNSDEDYLAFHDLYIQTMKAVNADSYYFFDKDYFLNFKSLLKTKQKLLVAEMDGKIIGALLLMIDGKFAHYHLSARHKDYSKFAANNFLLEKAIRIAQENGAEQFHFGGGNSADFEDPLYKFKTNFSKNRADFYIGKKIYFPDIYQKVCNSWEKKNPHLKQKYNNFLLKYSKTE